MSYADIAGLPFVAGLYADFSPLIIYAFFGSSRQIAVGPVAIISLLVYQSIPLCNKLCAESNGVNATVPVRFKRQIYTTMTETLPRSLLCLSPLSLLSLSSLTVCVFPMTHIKTKIDDVHTYYLTTYTYYTQILAAYGKCPSKCTATQTLVYNPEVQWLFL